MNKTNLWVMPICLVLVLGAYGTTRILMSGDNQGAPLAPAEPVVLADVKIERPILDAKQVQGPAAAKKDEPAAPRRAAILHRINVPTDVQPDQWGKTPFDIHDLAINADGTRLLTKSKKAVIYWDTKTGKALQTYLPPKPAWEYQEAKTDRVFMSPDTRLIATLTQNNRYAHTLELHETESKRLLGTSVPDKDNHLLDQMLPPFTPSGGHLLLYGEGKGGGLAIQAVATSDAAISSVHRSPKGFTQTQVIEMAPVPGEPIVIIYWRIAKNPVALDLRTGKETTITGITNKPWHLFFERGMDISADGKYLIASGINELQVCDWRTNETIVKWKQSDMSYMQPRFTPDGKRFIVMKHPQLDQSRGVIRFGGNLPPASLVLYDVAGRRQIGEFTLLKE